MNRLDGKVAVITGGASGIGKAAGELFVAQGAKVFLTDVNEDALEATAKEIGSDNVGWMVADVTSADDNKRMVAEAVERFGGVDILCANAGIEGDHSPTLEISEAAFDLVMAINVKGVLFGIQAAAPAMVERGGGSIVVTSSVAATFGGMAGYTTSKHAVTGLVKSAAKELAPMKIRVNFVNPGPVKTPLIERLAGEVEEWLLAQIPMGRYADPEEIANVMLFLASDDSSIVTGQMYLADGGYRA